MDVSKAIINRRSIRRYQEQKLSEDDLSKVLEAARLSPSARNDQARELLIIRDQTLKEELVSACRNQTFIRECSAFLIAIHNPEKRWSLEDCIIMMDHITLQATELGLGTCWIGAFEEDKVKAITGIPDNMRIAICMTIGYPDESPSPRPRKDVSEIVHWEKYNG